MAEQPKKNEEPDELPPPPKRPKTRAWAARLEALDRNRNQHFDPDKSSLDVLNSDALLAVFEYLDINSRFKVRRVSRKWNTVFEKSMRQLKILDLWDVIRTIDFKDNRSRLDSLDSWMTVIKYCSKQLEELRMSCYLMERFTKKRIQNLYRYCPDILALKLSYTSWYSGAPRSLACFTKLQSLFLSRARIRKYEHDLGRTFTSLENLKEVRLTSCTEISGTCLTKLHPEKLECLDIGGTYSITPASIKAFFSREWTVLERLNVSRLKLKMDNFMELVVAKAPRLKVLGVNFCSRRMTSNMENLVELENFRELQCVGVRGPPAYEYLSTLVSAYHKRAAERVETLNLCSLISEKLLLVSKLVGLKELHVCVHQYTAFGEQEQPIEVEKAISAIATGCPNLERLSLRRFHELGDECLAVIGRYCSLLTLFVCYDAPHVTSAGVRSLVDGLRASSRRPEGTKIYIHLRQCFGVDVTKLQMGDSWVSCT